MNSRNFFAELKRRNVYKVAVAYAVVAWLLIQAASILFPTFDAPSWAMKVLVALLVLCFPVALVLSWAFEITPEGIKLESEIDPKTPITRGTGRKIMGLTIAVAIVAAGLFSFQILRTSSHPVEGGAPATPNDMTTGVAGAPARNATDSVAGGRPSISEKSIAVLPFENLSEEKSNAYFAEGVQDEILTRLAKIGELKVISRTSTQHFNSAPQNLSQIAKQLGVANILEGSVQKVADQVRVNVQLINALTDAHLWAETYDRKLTDIFAVESDIAKTIADTLQAKLTGSEKTEMFKKPTENSAAYELYLKGRFFWNKRDNNDLEKALGYFQQAASVDPNYALAWSGIADVHVLLPLFGGANPADSYPKAKEAANKAAALDPNLAEPHTALGLIANLFDFDFSRSLAEFEKAIALNPNYATAHHWFGNSILECIGDFDRSIAEMKRAVELDPLSIPINGDVGVAYYYAGRYSEAVAQFRKALELDPNSYYVHYNFGEALELSGDLPGAIAEYQKATGLDDDPYPLALLGHAQALDGNREAALKILPQLFAARRYVPDYSIGLVYLGLGDTNQAMDWFEKSFAKRQPDMNTIRFDPLLKSLHGDQRFEALAEKVLPAQELKTLAASK